MEQRWHSVEQVAEQLGLHVRTVRGYIRDGRLPAVRIGKQYRIAPADLAAFTGRPAAVRARAEVSAVVEIDDIDATTADRLSTMLVAGAQMRGDVAHVRTVHDDRRRRLQVIILGGIDATADILRTIEEGPWLTK
ncbi:MAG TPA: helix-turn-helix domain-containing protein [Actinoplanes sp.]|nr:helix-turn-helix domain-containing protein [Actinoplanes sp.]